jgi:WD40 repeat protein
MNNTVKNPYVGPRTFQREDGDVFFGREREARDILSLIASERLVLFYAQSGAGKSSLLNTRLLPELEKDNFEVLPVGRLQGEPPAGIKVENIYLYNLMSSLVQQKFTPQSLTNISLSQFLAVLEFHDGEYLLGEESLTDIIQERRWPRVLIIDQFEEIFTVHLDAWHKREDFFCQLAQAMRDDPYLTVILIMREDYIASLDPYAHLLPGGLRMRYYMQRLNWEAALKAVKNPVANIRPYAEGIAERLVNDLASITVQKADGSVDVQTGQYIEPVQLQVVCYGLWDDLPPDRNEITADDILEIGDVDQSLERFYDKRVAAVATEKGVPERAIREWFEQELITPNRTRNMVLQDTNHNTEMPDPVIQSMRGDLVRAELRAGQIWYELSHDRLIRPVISSNAKWFEAHLSMFQRRVVMWEQQGKSESLLLREKELAQAEEESSTLHLTDEEKEFIEECRLLQKRNQRDLRQKRMIAGALVISIVFLIGAIVAYIDSQSQRKLAVTNANSFATAKVDAEFSAHEAGTAKANAEDNANIAATQQSKAEKETQKALAGKLAAEADSQKDSDYKLALLLSAKAFELESTPLTRTTLFNLLQFTPSTRLFGYSGPITSLAVSPDGKILASSNCKEYSDTQCAKGEITLTYTETYQLIKKISGEYGMVNSLAFAQSGDMLLLAAGGCVPVDDTKKGCTDSKGQITLWNVANPDSTEPELLSEFPSIHGNLVKTIAFTHDGHLLASGSFDKTVILWDVSDPKNPKAAGNPIRGHTSFVNSIAFSIDDKTLVSAGDDGNIFLWNISDPNAIAQRGAPIKQVASINSIAFSPNNTQFASASNDKTVTLWDWNTSKQTLGSSHKLLGHDGYVQSLAFNADDSILASVGFDGKVLLWDTSKGTQKGLQLLGHTRAINAVVFDSIANSNSLYLFSGGNDRTIIRWDISSWHPLSQLMKTETVPEGIGVEDSIRNHSAHVENDQQIILDNQPLKNGHTGKVNSLQFGELQNGILLLASASDDQTVILWNVPKNEADPIFLKLDGFSNPVNEAYFDNGQLVTVEKSSGNTINITRWDIDPATWKSHVCKNIHLTDLDKDQLTEWKLLITDPTYQLVCQ